MKKLIVLIAAAALLTGCTSTFGSFANLKQGDSSKQQVLSMLGKPLAKRYVDDKEVWQYKFYKKDAQGNKGMQTILNLDVTFEKNNIDNYNITVSQESVKESRPLPQSRKPIQSQGEQSSPFINHLDRNGDGKVSRREFPGSDQRFNSLDANRDGYIDAGEAPSPQQHRQRQEQRQNRRR